MRDTPGTERTALPVRGVDTLGTSPELATDTDDRLCVPDQMTNHVCSMGVFGLTAPLNTCLKLAIVFISLTT